MHVCCFPTSIQTQCFFHFLVWKKTCIDLTSLTNWYQHLISLDLTTKGEKVKPKGIKYCSGQAVQMILILLQFGIHGSGTTVELLAWVTVNWVKGFKSLQ